MGIGSSSCENTDEKCVLPVGSKDRTKGIRMRFSKTLGKRTREDKDEAAHKRYEKPIDSKRRRRDVDTIRAYPFSQQLHVLGGQKDIETLNQEKCTAKTYASIGALVQTFGYMSQNQFNKWKPVHWQRFVDRCYATISQASAVCDKIDQTWLWSLVTEARLIYGMEQILCPTQFLFEKPAEFAKEEMEGWKYLLNDRGVIVRVPHTHTALLPSTREPGEKFKAHFEANFPMVQGLGELVLSLMQNKSLGTDDYLAVLRYAQGLDRRDEIKDEGLQKAVDSVFNADGMTNFLKKLTDEPYNQKPDPEGMAHADDQFIRRALLVWILTVFFDPKSPAFVVNKKQGLDKETWLGVLKDDQHVLRRSLNPDFRFLETLLWQKASTGRTMSFIRRGYNATVKTVTRRQEDYIDNGVMSPRKM